MKTAPALMAWRKTGGCRPPAPVGRALGHGEEGQVGGVLSRKDGQRPGVQKNCSGWLQPSWAARAAQVLERPAASSRRCRRRGRPPRGWDRSEGVGAGTPRGVSPATGGDAGHEQALARPLGGCMPATIQASRSRKLTLPCQAQRLEFGRRPQCLGAFSCERPAVADVEDREQGRRFIASHSGQEPQRPREGHARGSPRTAAGRPAA